MKKLYIRAAAILLAAALIFVPKTAAISAEKAIVMDALTGRVLYEKRAEEKSLVASCTKILTAILVCENCNALDLITIPKEAVGIEGSSMYLVEGERLTVQELLYGLMLSSGNDAAVALALHCAGSLEGFSALMNEKAQALGMTGSHFVNPHGLDAREHYSTARDLAVLAAYAMENPIFAATVGAKSVRVGQRVLQNHNRLLWQYPDAEGVKTGFTRAAGRILVSSAKRQGRRLICVTINAPNDWLDHKSLLEAGFSSCEMTTLVHAGQRLGSLPVFGGTGEQVQVEAAESFAWPIFEGETVTVILPLQGPAFAPVVEGADAGYAHILVEGKPVGKVKLYYSETIEQQPGKEKTLLERLLERIL
jgi:D-alanyl-D-alanine carboxypeptidase